MATKAGQEANETSRVTSGQLLLIAGAILTFSASVMSNSQAVTQLSHGWKIRLILSWILFATSALVSIISLITDYYFFKGWNKYNLSVAKAITKKRDYDEAIDSNIDIIPRETSPIWPLLLQLCLIFSGMVLFLEVISHILLSN